MKVWKVINLYCGDEELEYWLNIYETEGKKIKEIMYIGKFEYKIIYTEKDTVEEANND